MMKNSTHPLLTQFLVMAFLVGAALTAFAQTPGIPYQAYFTKSVHLPGDQVDAPLANTQISLEFKVRNAAGVEYTERITVTTDAYGMASTIVGTGKGTVIGDPFSAIVWDGNPKTLDIDIDFTNSGSYTDHGEMPIIYVPGPSDSIDIGLFTGVGVPTTADPAGAKAGDVYVDQSTGVTYGHNGNAWVPSRGVLSGPSAPDSTTPPNAQAGDVYVDETTGDLYAHDGTEWILSDNQNTEAVEVTDGTLDVDGDGVNDNDVMLQDMIDNIGVIVKANETVTTLENNNDGTFTYTSEDDTKTTFAITQTGIGAPTAAGAAGQLYVDTATGNVYAHDGTNWTQVGADEITVGTADPDATNTTSPAGGDVYVNETTGELFTYNSTTSAWESQSANDGSHSFSSIALAHAITPATPAAASANPIAGDTHTVSYPDHIVNYIYNGTAWAVASEYDIVAANDGNHAVGIIATAKPSITPAAPTAANLPATPIAGDTVTEVYDDFVVSYAYDGSTWTAVEYSKALDGSHAVGVVSGNKPTTTPTAPTATNVPANPISGDTVTEVYDDTVVNYVYDGTNWAFVEYTYAGANDGNQSFATTAAMKPTTTPTTPLDAPTSLIAGDTHTVVYSDFVVNYTYDGSTWTAVEYAIGVTDGNQSFETIATAHATTPTTPAAAPATAVAGDTHTVLYPDHIVHYTHNGMNWSVAAEHDYATANDGNQTFATIALAHTLTPATPVSPPASPAAGDTHTVNYPDHIVNYVYSGSAWSVASEYDVTAANDGSQTFATATGAKPMTTPTTPVGAPATSIAGDTHSVNYTDFLVNYTYDGSTWSVASEFGLAPVSGTSPWFGTDDNMAATSNTEHIYQSGNVGIGTSTITSPLQVAGPIATPVVATSAAITLDATQSVLHVDATAGNVAVTLPTATAANGRVYTVIKTDYTTNRVVFDKTIMGTDFSFTEVNVPGSYRLQSDGANWLLIK